MKQILYISVLAIILAACTTSKTTISNSANLDKYEYASLINIMSYNGSAELMDTEVQIYNAIETTRLKMIGDRRINELSPEQKERLLLVRFSASQSDEESIVSVNFVDYMTGKPIASCRGAFGLGWDKNCDMKEAIKRVTKQIKDLFNYQ